MRPSAELAVVPVDTESASSTARLQRILTWVLIVGGGIGWISSFVLTVEKLRLAEDPEYVPSCSINPVLSCGSVMATPQAELFGFANSLLGVTGFAVVVTVGAARLAGAVFQRWFWLALQLGTTAGAVLVHWLIVQSLYRIDALCPYCMTVWAATIVIFWYVTLACLNHLRGTRGTRISALLVANHAVPLTIWVLAVLGLIAQRFWNYWSTLV